MAKAESTKKTPTNELFDRNTQSFIYNNQVNATQRMLDFDYAAGRETSSVAAIINPTGSDSFSRFTSASVRF
jgi:hypothetical protein